jgi:NAD(P)-dependent dehydrogenase (short-subunit alcohol dehydrogenase family)
MSFEGRVAIVTGAGSPRGIGRGIAVCLAKKGADIVIADVNLDRAKAVAEEIRCLGGNALAIEVNVTDVASVDKMVELTLKEFNRVDILINNAGITQPIRTIDMTVEDFEKIIDVNLKGTFICSKAVLKTMIEKKYGRIVNMSSVSAKRGGGVYGGSHYSASKAGVLGFAKALAREVVEYGITVNSVAPGLVDTDIRVGLSTDMERAIWENIPMKRPATVMEIAETAAFLASDEASYITGEEIDVNGGSHMD